MRDEEHNYLRLLDYFYFNFNELNKIIIKNKKNRSSLGAIWYYLMQFHNLRVVSPAAVCCSLLLHCFVYLCTSLHLTSAIYYLLSAIGYLLCGSQSKSEQQYLHAIHCFWCYVVGMHFCGMVWFRWVYSTLFWNNSFQSSLNHHSGHIQQIHHLSFS